MLTGEGQIIYAVERAYRCKSTVLVSVLNLFGQAQGFDEILEVISDPNTSLEHVTDLLILISGSVDMYHKSFVDSYFSALNTAVQEKILSATEA